MKVLVTTDNVGGVWTYALDLTRSLAQRGTQVVLAVMGEEMTPQQRDEAKAAGCNRVVAASYALEWMPEPWADVDVAGDWLLDVAEQETPDIVHLNGYSHAALPWKAPVVVVAHSCVRSWWRAVRRAEAAPEWDEYTRRLSAGLAAADAIVAPTGAMATEVRTIYGPHLSVEVIYNGRDTSDLFAEPKDELVLGAGRLWDEAKNAAALAKAATSCRWPVYLAGEDAHRDRPGIEHLGRLDPDEMKKWLRRAAIFAAPARYEPFGLAALEAAFCGCALVLGDIPSLREVWGDAAVYVDPDDDKALAAILGRLIDDPPALAAWGDRARRRAQRYQIGPMSDNYSSLYQRLANGAPA